MNKLPLPEVDDLQTLTALANNVKLASYPLLIPHIEELQAAYQNYEMVSGVAAHINPVALPANIVCALHAHFKSPPKALDFISKDRGEAGHKTCPLCGSLHSGTVDHLIPRTPYPAFSIFSRNLVRACKCNSTKNAAVEGAAPGERILHPYFDDCLSERLLRANIRDHGKAPKITIEVVVPPAHPAHAAIDYHVRTIVDRTAVKGFLHDRWAAMCRKPANIVPHLDQLITSRPQLQEVLKAECRRIDEVRESKNNWESIFIAGLLEADTFEWLFARLSSPAYTPGSSLEWT